MAFCFSGSLLRANFNIVFFLFILLLFVANKFLLHLVLARTILQNIPICLLYLVNLLLQLLHSVGFRSVI